MLNVLFWLTILRPSKRIPSQNFVLRFALLYMLCGFENLYVDLESRILLILKGLCHMI